MEEARSRRLLEEIHRRLEVVPHEPEVLDQRGLTPLLQIGNLKLKHVFTVDKAQPWLIGHAEFSEEYHERRRLQERQENADGIVDVEETGFREGSRRLSIMQTALVKQVAETPFVFTIPQDRVRLFAALNAAAIPEAAWTNASNTFWDAGGLVHVADYHNGGKMIYTHNLTMYNNISNLSNLTDPIDPLLYTPIHTGPYTPDNMGKNFSQTEVTNVSHQAQTIGNAWRDGQALRGARQPIIEQAKQAQAGIENSWRNDFMGLRLFECKDLEPPETQTSPRCWKDPGVAISWYEEPTKRVLVFHPDWSINHYEYMLWLKKAWIIDMVEQQIWNQWVLDSRKTKSQEQADNKGLDYDELQERCAFKDQESKPFIDVKSFGKALLLNMEDLSLFGYWPLVKRIIRVVLPEGRSPALEKGVDTYLTGTGSGGTYAALASMYIKKTDDFKYDTYSIAGEGFECYARSLSGDMNPWEDHDQIHVYAHLMDVYARMDFVSGRVCLYGWYNMTEGTDVYDFCSKIVGYTGPQLLYRGKTFYHEPVEFVGYQHVGKDGLPDQYAKVKMARKYFDACHYYTHSIWYAAMLFLDPNILMRDGTTDGGCKKVDSIPQADALGKCPTGARVHQDCTSIVLLNLPFPLVSCIVVATGMASFFCTVGLLLQMFLKLIDNKMWVFQSDTHANKSLFGLIWFIFMQVICMFNPFKKHQKVKKKKRKGCKAQAARDRAMQAKMAKFQKEIGIHEKKKKGDDDDGAEKKGDKAWAAVQSRIGGLGHMRHVDQTGGIGDAAMILGNTQSAVVVIQREEGLIEEAKAGEGAKDEDSGKKKPDRKSRRDGDKDRDRDRTRLKDARDGGSARPSLSSAAPADSSLKVPGARRSVSKSPRTGKKDPSDASKGTMPGRKTSVSSNRSAASGDGTRRTSRTRSSPAKAKSSSSKDGGKPDQV